MVVYKNALLKYIRSYSTWIPLVLSIIVVFGLGVLFPFLLFDPTAPDAIYTYQANTIFSASSLISALALFSITFTSYKGVQIYKNEIEDGSFLILVSKPISRKRIIYEKWFALVTIIFIYSFITIFIYQLLIVSCDPGRKILNIENYDIYSNKVWSIGFILLGLLLMLNLLFSSIALILSTKLSSAITIATLAGIGTFIPISGLLPTFLVNSPFLVVSNTPLLSLEGQKLNQSETNNYLNSLLKSLNLQNDYTYNNDKFNQNLNDFSNTYKQISSSTNYFNRISLNTNKTNYYQYFFFIDYFYQLNEMSSLATNLFWNGLNKYDIVNSSSSLGASLSSPRSDLNGKPYISQKNINTQNLINKIIQTFSTYKNLISTNEYLNNYYLLFDLILKLRSINIIEKTTSINYLKNLEKLISSFYNPIQNKFNSEYLNSFIRNPILSSIVNSSLISPQLKNDINNNKKPIKKNIIVLENIFKFKLLQDLGLSSYLIINDSKINNYYYQHNFNLLNTTQDFLGSYVPTAQSQQILDSFLKKYPSFNEIINYCSLNLSNGKKNINYQSVINILNLLWLHENYNEEINEINFKPYANPYLLLSIYLSITFLLIPLTYWIISKQDIR